MRSLRHSLPLLTLLGLMPGSGDGPGVGEERAIAGCAAQAAPEPAGRRVRHTGRRGGEKRMQGRDGR